VNSFLSSLGQLFQRYTVSQRIIIIIVMLGILSSVISLVMWANRPEYDILFSDIEPATAGEIISELRAAKVPYKLEDRGRTIYIPVEQVSEMRLQLAEKGYGTETVKGYEIFDDSKVGMTTFMQELNARRALEGELTKTINQFPEVRNSRVHLVLPENKLFESDQRGSASVVVHLVSGKRLDMNQVDGIAALVSNSVKGIEPEDVSIVDSDGKLISVSKSDDQVMGMAGSQWELRSREEQKLQSKVTDIVESIVGKENAVVKVAIEMNFEKIERTSEIPDPNTVVVVSEETHTETVNDRDTANTTGENRKQENTITNYEIGQLREHYINNSGFIEKISVAVLLNGKYVKTTDNQGNELQKYVPRSSKEINQISALIRSAVGYDEERGDVVEVQNIELSALSFAEDSEYFVKAERQNFMQNLIRNGLIGIGILVCFLVVRSMFKSAGKRMQLAPIPMQSRALNAKSAPVPESVEQEVDLPEEMYVKKLSPEAKAKLKAKDKMTSEVVDYVKGSPEDAAKLIRSWLTQPSQ
jgi:flagellar M-ring protein FliF